MFEKLYLEEFQKSLQKIQIDPDLPSFQNISMFKNLYESKWHEFKAKASFNPFFIVCDGSKGETEFQGGIKALHVRALACGPKDLGIPDVKEVHNYVKHMIKKPESYMKAIEFNALRKILSRISDKDIENIILLYDGSLYPILLESILYEEELLEATLEELSSLAKLYKEAFNKKLTLIGVSKDSSATYVKTRILLESIAKLNPRIGERISKKRYPWRIVKELKRVLKEENLIQEEKEILEKYLQEFKLKTVDVGIFDSLNLKPGFSIPLVLAPSILYLGREVSNGTNYWDDSVIKIELEKHLEATKEMDEEYQKMAEEIAKALDEIYSLPPLVIIYWKPYHGFGVYRVEISGWSLGIKVPCKSLSENYFLEEPEVIKKCEEIVSKLNALSPSPYAVKPLIEEVDELVRLPVKTYREIYEPAIIEELKKRGLCFQLSRRRIREIILRGF